ncbi:MAG: peptidoglycan-binding protein [Ilumatobacter sp.]|uniref:peptidoglycan-binding protein n=1 Tax=Ilumatobacter sp. TaxID=1967498 RepID=UPI00391DE2F9
MIDAETGTTPVTDAATANVDEPHLPFSTSSRVRRWGSSSTLWLVAVVALCAGAAGAWWLASSSQSPEQAAARADAPMSSWVTATVERRVLSATVIQRGDVAAEVSVAVEPPVSVESPAVVTIAPPPVGGEVVEGDVVVEVSGRPVFVLDGTAPMYRSLRPGMSGADVVQLQVALARLGYEPDADGVFGEATKAAVTTWYGDAGYEPVAAFDTAAADTASANQSVDDATVALDVAAAALRQAQQGASTLEVTQAEAAVDQAERSLGEARAQRVNEVRLGEETYNAAIRERDRLAQNPETTPSELEAAELQILQAAAQLDSTRRSTADAVTSAEEALLIATLSRDTLLAPADLTELQRGVDSASGAQAQAQAALAAVMSQNGPTIPLGEALFVPQLPARVRTSAGTNFDPAGDTGDGGSGPLVELAGGRLVVTTSMRPGDVDLVRVGMPVSLLDETTSTEYPATITSIVKDPVPGPDGQLVHPAVITPDAPLPDGLVGANLRVTITAASTEDQALVVPLAAVTSAADGTTRVSLVDSVNDENPIDVVVDAGLSADGFVAIVPVTPEAVSVDDLVVVGR